MKRYKKHLFLIPHLVLFLIFSAHSKDFITPEKDKALRIGKDIYILKDPDSKYTIEQIRETYLKDFKRSKQETPLFGITSSTIWVMLKTQNLTEEQMYLEIENPLIDSISFYAILPDLSTKETITGEYNLSDTKKNSFFFELNAPHQQEGLYFLKLKSTHALQLPMKVGGLKAFFVKNHQKDLFHGIYYGLILLVICFNSFIFWGTKDPVYLYYVMYSICIGLLMAHYNGYAFEYIWPFVGWNPHLTIIIVSISATSGILFAMSFLQSHKLSTRLHTGFYYIIGLFFANVILSHLGYNKFSPYISLIAAFICTLYCFGISIYIYSKGYKPAKFFIIAFTVFTVGVIVFTLKDFNILPHNAFTNQSILVGSGLEIILFSIALADKINTYKREKEVARKEVLDSQKALIEQLKEKEYLKDKLNKELEEKVKERTRELQEKNNELDTFVYKASHDIKGPLKSILGLTIIGQKDIKDAAALNYFDHIYKSTLRLDTTLNDLLNLTKVKEIKPDFKTIDFKDILDNVISSFEHAPGYEEVKIGLDIVQDRAFKSDKKLLYSIIQNMIENAIKYRDISKEQCSLDICISVDDTEARLSFSDNGLGIGKENQLKIFEMFYKINRASIGSGLGLYITKISIEKLNGKIIVNSIKEQGTTFVITIPHREIKEELLINNPENI